MSFFKKMLSKVGVGAAKIDTIIEPAELMPGDAITGKIIITGGSTEQNINKIDLDVYCNYSVETEVEEEDDEGNVSTETKVISRNYKLLSHDINESFTINPDETREIPFEIPLPETAPLTMGKTKTWLSTNLDIESALDKKDKDYVKVVPTELQLGLFSAMSALGFELREADCEGSDKVSFDGVPFIQEFEYKPTSGSFAGKLDEVELVPKVKDGGIEVIMEVDRKARGVSGLLAEMMGTDESKICFTIQPDELDGIQTKITEIIEANAF